MMGRGDWKKLEDQINLVLRPMGERIAALEAKLGLEVADEPTETDLERTQGGKKKAPPKSEAA